MQIVGIAIKRMKRGLMEPLESVEVTEDGGLSGDHRGHGGLTGGRQVTVISLEQWEEACKEIGQQLTVRSRRANVAITGYTFGPGDVNKVICFNNGVTLQVTGETKPCKRMDEISMGLLDALTPNWRGGVTCRVLRGGTLRLNESFS